MVHYINTVPSATDLHKVMFIEKSRGGQDIAIKYLRAKGMGVDRFSSGMEAIRAASLDEYTMIFIVSRLPDMSGQCIAKKIRELPAHSQTPLIAVVANNEESESNLDDEFNDQLQKPMTGSLLFQLAEGHWDMKKAIHSFLQ